MGFDLRVSLEALVAELKRLRADGVQSVYLETQTLNALQEHAKALEAEGFSDLLAREFGSAAGAASAGGQVGGLSSPSLPQAAGDGVSAGGRAVGDGISASGRAAGDGISSSQARGEVAPAKPSGRKRSEFSDGSEDFLATAATAQAADKGARAVSAVSAASGGHTGAGDGKTAPQGLPPGVKPLPQPVPFELPQGDKQTQWDWLLNRVQTDPVCLEHLNPGKKLVLGTGSLDADIFFCGEAPGQEEEAEGEPFVGPAGQLLTKIILAMGLQRSDVYIGNIMNWRPEHDKPYGNRAPVEAEIRYCLPYLLAQLQIVRPRVVVALGLTAANGLLGVDPRRTLGRMRGRWLEVAGYPLMVTYHPSYLLRNGTLHAKRMVWEDIMLAMEKVGMPISAKQRQFFTKA